MLHRRVRLAGAVVAFASVVALAVAAGPPPHLAEPDLAHAATAGSTSERPNVVLILADDLDATVTPVWSAMPKTAALLRDTGMTFTNAFVASPDCCPARTSLLLGSYPHNNGVYASGGDFGGWTAFHANGDEQKTFAQQLHDGGYRTALFGKYLNQYRVANAGLAPPPGWDEWDAMIDDIYYTGYGYSIDHNGTLEKFGTAESDYSTDVLAARTVEFVDAAAADPSQPFFAYVAPTAPHYPLPPPPRYASNAWSNATAPTSPNFYEADLSDKPTWLQVSAPYRDQWKPNIDVDYRNRMGSLLALDDLVSDVVSALDRNGQLANTYVVFTSDNGYSLGAHHLSGKLAPYEESIRVPLVVAGPGVPHATDGHMVQLGDLAPTVLELAGLAPTTTMDMRSIAPLLGGAAPASWRKDMLVERRFANAASAKPANYYVLAALYDMPSYAAVRTTRYLLVEWYQQNELGGKHEYELYDLAADRYQLNNLVKTSAGVQQYATTFTALLQRLRQLQTCRGATCG